MTASSTRVGSTLAGSYRLERKIGSGAMATVYLAEDVKHHRKVAVKMLHPELSAVLGAERFLKEIELTASLQHPHILPLFDSGNVDGLLFYVMPFVDGETLRTRLSREQQLPLHDAIRITTEVADALDYAHRRGVVHRDIKPENILLHDGRPLVADFGIALAVQQAGGTRMTQTGMSLGTPQYMSPEQAMGERAIDARADVYALAAVCYEMLVGEPPFTGPTMQAIIAKTVTETPRPLTALRHTVPRHVEAAVGTALEKMPADRFASAGEFARALAGPVDGASTSGAPSATRRRPNGLAVAATFAGIVGLALGFAVGSRSGTDPSLSDARQWNIALPDSAPFAFFGDAPLGIWQTAIAVSPDGETIAYVARRRQGTQIYIRRMDDQVARPLVGTEGAFHPFFSPDANWVGYFAGSELRKTPVGGGPSVVLGRFRMPVGAAWSRSDSILVVDAEGSDPSVISAGGGTPRKLAVGALGPVTRRIGLRQPRLLPDGKWALGTLGGGYLALLSLESGRLFYLTQNGTVPANSANPPDRLAGRRPLYVASGHLVFLTGDGVLTAVAFDARRRRVTGPPVPILNGVRTEETYGFGQVDISENGTLVYAPGRNASIGLIGLVDTVGRIDTLAFPNGEYNNMFVDPTGSRAVAQRRTGNGRFEVVLLDLEREVPQVILTGEYPLAWWPDGDSLIVSSALRARPGIDSVSNFALNGGSRRSLPTWMGTVRDVSPDGRWLAGADSATVRLIPPNDTTRAVSLGAGGTWMSFSPDGRWLAFAGVGSDGGIILARVPFDGRRRQVSSDNGEQPRWSWPGDRLIYRRGSQFMAVDVNTSTGAVGKPRLLLEGPFPRVTGWSYDIVPDGRLLVIVGPNERTVRHLNVITNFGAELSRLPRPGR